jgi:hypothetical protein
LRTISFRYDKVSLEKIAQRLSHGRKSDHKHPQSRQSAGHQKKDQSCCNECWQCLLPQCSNLPVVISCVVSMAASLGSWRSSFNRLVPALQKTWKLNAGLHLQYYRHKQTELSSSRRDETKRNQPPRTGSFSSDWEPVIPPQKQKRGAIGAQYAPHFLASPKL